MSMYEWQVRRILQEAGEENFVAELENLMADEPDMPGIVSRIMERTGTDETLAQARVADMKLIIDERRVRWALEIIAHELPGKRAEYGRQAKEMLENFNEKPASKGRKKSYEAGYQEGYEAGYRAGYEAGHTARGENGNERLTETLGRRRSQEQE